MCLVCRIGSLFSFGCHYLACLIASLLSSGCLIGSVIGIKDLNSGMVYVQLWWLHLSLWIKNYCHLGHGIGGGCVYEKFFILHR